jgi:hypothetical protein
LLQADTVLTARTTNPAALAGEARRQMYALFERYYCATSRVRFEADLEAKDTVILLEDGAREIFGFTTLAVGPARVGARNLRVVFSGDTIVDPRHWGSQALAFAWIREIGRIYAEEPATPLYWLLIVKGHRTYRYLTAFGLEFVPHWSGRNRADLVALRDDLARDRFGRDYDAAAGVVKFTPARERLADAVAEASEREQARPDVRHFLKVNPGYRLGHELVCLCELSAANMKPLTRRLFLKGVG